MPERLAPMANSVLKDMEDFCLYLRTDFHDLGRLFNGLDRWEDFEKVATEEYPREIRHY